MNVEQETAQIRKEVVERFGKYKHYEISQEMDNQVFMYLIKGEENSF